MRTRRRDPLVIPWITGVVSLASVAAYAIPATGVDLPAITGGGPVRWNDPLHIVGLGARSTPLVADTGEAWRLLTCHFVHTSWMHVLFNLAFLFAVGGAIEQVTRRSDYAALILFTGLASSMSSLIGTPQVSAGASGLVFGVLGAAVTLGLRHHPRLGRRVRRYFGLWVLPFLLIVFGFGVGNPSVDQASHLGGLIGGLAGGLVMSLREPRAHPSPYRPVPLVAVSALTVSMLLAAPVLARGGHPPRRVVLSAGSSIEVPGTWATRHSATGELEFVTAGGMVTLATERLPYETAEDEVAYETRELQLEEIVVHDDTMTPDPTAPADGRSHLRYAFVRDDTPMIRDVFFLRPRHQARWATVLSFETPRTWTDKYAGIRASILSSVQEQSPGSPSGPAISVAALQ